MYTSIDFTIQIIGRRGSLIPQTRGSHTSIWCGLAVTIKIDYYYYYYYYYKYFENDPDGCRWPPTYSNWFILAVFQFGSFFPSFRVPDLRGRFEALNNVFRARHNRK
jgi:hypothetical protein